jgi:tRNA modification GTPase
VKPIKQALVELIAALEAGIDFAEDDLDLLPQAEIIAKIAAMESPLAKLAGTFTYGRVLREGFTLAIVGRPNAGKSSLFNRLLDRDRAIVTPLAGTTRDPISESMSLDGIPVELIDTAGLRDAPTGPEGEAEAQGIARSRNLMADADVVLLVLDATTYAVGTPLRQDDAATLVSLQGRHTLVALNKSDLAPTSGGPLDSAVRTSALTGEGIAELKQAIHQRVAGPAGESALVTNVRQHNALNGALASLSAAHQAAKQALPHEMLLLDLHGALDALDSLTGATSTEDILTLIFSTFCIGK